MGKLSLIFLFSFLSAFTFANETETVSDDVWWEKVSHYITQADKENFIRLKNIEKKLIGLEVIVADKGEGGASRFGHTLLRFVDNDSNPTNDFILSVVAKTDSINASVIKGIKGDYPIWLNIRTLGEYWEEYVSIEKRPLKRYILSTDESLRSKILETLSKWVFATDRDKVIGKYTFLKNNCTGVLYKLFVESGMEKGTFFSPKIPVKFHKWLYKNGYSIFPTILINTNHELILRLSKVLSINEADLLTGNNWPENSLFLIRENFNSDEIKRILVEIQRMPTNVFKSLARENKFKGEELLKSMDIKTLPSNMYRICENEECAKENYNFELTFWDKSERFEIQEHRENALSRINESKFKTQLELMIPLFYN